MKGYWEHLQELAASGRPFAAVTLVDVIASAPANAGAKMLVTSDGLFFGSVGGGKIEAKALAEARAMLADGARLHTQNQAGATHRFAEWNLQRDVGMTCGGAVRMFFEAYNIVAWPIIIFGAGHCAQALVRVLLSLQCHVTVIDARGEWLDKLPAGGPEIRLRAIHAAGPLAEHVKDLPANAFVLLMTMGHATDQPILVEILKTRADDFPYLGVIGSEAKANTLRKGVLAAGVPESLLSRYCCPIGLPIGTNDPAEIAVSIAAQLLQKRDALATPTPA